MSFSAHDWESFQIQVPGKWVLCGEHTVLREGTAIALPHPSVVLSLEYRAHPGALEVHPKENSSEIQDMIDAVLEQFRTEGRSISAPQGSLHIRSSIPMGAGLGSSAALSVALAEWLAAPLDLPPEDRLILARQLEDRFHGRSSGMDVAVVQARRPIAFSTELGPQVLEVPFPLYVSFHDTGLRARTSECVETVRNLLESSPSQAQKGEDAMKHACHTALQACALPSSQALQARTLWVDAMNQAQHAFEMWGLVPVEAQKIREKLASEGALASRLTGAGNGGFVVALWASPRI